uniref:Uncharacterized protein n=1 Tax=Ditylenchus dipsaci TaxID=166011 RepID=A0A915DRG7_9BILA
MSICGNTPIQNPPLLVDLNLLATTIRFGTASSDPDLHTPSSPCWSNSGCDTVNTGCWASSTNCSLPPNTVTSSSAEWFSPSASLLCSTICTWRPASWLLLPAAAG